MLTSDLTPYQILQNNNRTTQHQEAIEKMVDVRSPSKVPSKQMTSCCHPPVAHCLRGVLAIRRAAKKF